MTNFRPLPFVLAASNHGTMILNHNDVCYVKNTEGEIKGAFGVGHQILQKSVFDGEEIDVILNILKLQKQYKGNGVIALDCGANIGVHTIEMAKLMFSWGEVIAFEAQQYIYYALAGNIVINNCLNATAHHVALGKENGSLEIPVPNYYNQGSFGSLELKKTAKTEYIGQEVSYTAEKLRKTTMITIDHLNLERVDFIKMDVEGMEEDVLAGAEKTIRRFNPVMSIEVIKSDQAKIISLLKEWGYEDIFPFFCNILTYHKDDPIKNNFSQAKASS